MVFTRYPDFIRDCREQYSFKINVRCGGFDNKIVGQYFFRGCLTSEGNRQFLVNDISKVFDYMDLNYRRSLLYQLDSAILHQTSECLNQLFRNNVIGRGWQHYWSSRSPVLMPSGFSMRGYLNQNVYKRRLFSKKERLQRNYLCANMNPQFIRNIVEGVSRITIICIEREE